MSCGGQVIKPRDNRVFSLKNIIIRCNIRIFAVVNSILFFLKKTNMQAKITPTAFLLFACLLLTSCVGKKKYMDALGASFSCAERETQLTKRLDNTNVQIRQLTRENDLLEKRINQLESEKAAQKDEIIGLRSQVDDITGRAMSEQARLDKALQNKAAELEKREKVLNAMQTLREQNDAAVTDIQFKIFQVVGSFADDELKIEQRDGKVVISVFDKVMFNKNQTRIRSRGKELLEAIAGVAATRPELGITVTGHSPSRGSYGNAWEFSAMRAAAVAGELTNKHGIAPTRLTAAGRADSEPRYGNTEDPENLRTEITFTPRFQEIYRVLKNG